MIFEVYFNYTDNQGNEFSDKLTVKALSKEEAIIKYNKYAVEHNCIGVDNLDNVQELKIDIE